MCDIYSMPGHLPTKSCRICLGAFQRRATFKALASIPVIDNSGVAGSKPCSIQGPAGRTNKKNNCILVKLKHCFGMHGDIKETA